MTLPGMRERTLRIGSAGKTFSLTGWKVGYVRGRAAADRRRRPGAPVPHLHHAAQPAAGGRPTACARTTATSRASPRPQRHARPARGRAARASASTCCRARAPISRSPTSGRSASTATTTPSAATSPSRPGVAAIPVSAFYARGTPALVRFCFCKQDAMLDEASRAANPPVLRCLDPRRTTRATDGGGCFVRSRGRPWRARDGLVAGDRRMRTGAGVPADPARATSRRARCVRGRMCADRKELARTSYAARARTSGFARVRRPGQSVLQCVPPLGPDLRRLAFGASLPAGDAPAVGRRVNGLACTRILEVGVGTGLSLPLYGADKRIAGVDVSPEMLAHGAHAGPSARSA